MSKSANASIHRSGLAPPTLAGLPAHLCENDLLRYLSRWAMFAVLNATQAAWKLALAASVTETPAEQSALPVHRRAARRGHRPKPLGGYRAFWADMLVRLGQLNASQIAASLA
jgi:hypothetical protein